MQGKIVKGISGFYYVHVGEPGIYECKAKGAFRNQKIKPLVGDDVEIAIVDEETKKGNIEKILPRKNELIRPAVANIDLALIIFAAAKPQPNFNLLDRFLIMMEYQKVPVTICFNKKDLLEESEIEEFAGVLPFDDKASPEVWLLRSLHQCGKRGGNPGAACAVRWKDNCGSRSFRCWKIISGEPSPAKCADGDRQYQQKNRAWKTYNTSF